MLLDINAYTGHWPFQQLQYNTLAALLERMNRFGVDVSVVSQLNGIFYKNTQSANEELAKELKSNKAFANRFIPFAVINPIYAGWRRDLDTSIKQLGFKGVRIYPKYHDYELTDPAAVELVKRVRDHGLPVAISIRMVDNRERSFMDLDYTWNLKNILPIIHQVPDARYMILNHANTTTLNNDELALVKKTNLLIDTSGRAITRMPDFLQQFGSDKFAFGTHAPVLDYLTGLLRIASLHPSEADAPTIEMLRSGNARKMLSL